MDANRPVSPFIQNIAGVLLTTAIIGLATWSFNTSIAVSKLGVAIEGHTNRLDTQAARLTAAQSELATMQVQFLREVQTKSDSIIDKMESGEHVREARSDTLNTKLDGLSTSVNGLTAQVAVVVERLNNYIVAGQQRNAPEQR